MIKHLPLADDNANIRKLVRYAMTKEGYQVHEAHDGLVAVKLMEHERIDLAIIDIMMPGLDGFDLCDYIRTNYDIPIIMLTALDQLSDKKQGYLRGTDDYVTEPFDPEELVLRVKALFRRYHRTSSDIIRMDRIVIGRKNVEVTDGQSVHYANERIRTAFTACAVSGAAFLTRRADSPFLGSGLRSR